MVVSVCNVKYIDIKSIESDELHVININSFVKHSADFQCEKYEDLHKAVLENSPEGYMCIEPLALFHEVMWSCGLSKENGVVKRVTTCRDQLHHAIEESEYNLLVTNVSHKDPILICVDVVSVGPDMRVMLST